jgi:hypothetical protein
MTISRRYRPTGLAFAAAAFVIALTIGSQASAALAHGAVNESSPAEGATVTELDSISLTFGDPIINLGGTSTAFVIQVIGPDGRYYDAGCAELSGTVISAPVELGAAGEYLVRWQVASADGHPVSDTYTFDYAPTATAVKAEGQPQPLNCGAGTPPDMAADVNATTPSPSGPSGLVVGLLLGGAFIVVVGLSMTLLMRHSRRGA